MGQADLIGKIKNGILSKDPKAEIYLYGSRARGNSRNDSPEFDTWFSISALKPAKINDKISISPKV